MIGGSRIHISREIAVVSEVIFDVARFDVRLAVIEQGVRAAADQLTERDVSGCIIRVADQIHIEPFAGESGLANRSWRRSLFAGNKLTGCPLKCTFSFPLSALGALCG